MCVFDADDWPFCPAYGARRTRGVTSLVPTAARERLQGRYAENSWRMATVWLHTLMKCRNYLVVTAAFSGSQVT